MSEESPWRTDIWTFAKCAKEHWKEIVGSSFAFLLIGVLASVGLNVPPIASGIATLCFAVAAASFFCWRDERKKGESLSERLQPRLQVTVDKKSIADAIWNGDEWMIFLRIVVSSLTERRIQNAKAYLVSIEKESKTLWDNEELPLTFSPGENQDALCKTIEHGGSYPIDVVIVRRGDNALFMGTPGRTWPHFNSLYDIFSESGDYIISIRVSADDCPSIVARVLFKWGGDSFNCGIDVLPPSPQSDPTG